MTYGYIFFAIIVLAAVLVMVDLIMAAIDQRGSR